MKNDDIKPAPYKLITTHQSDDDIIIKYLQGKLEKTEVSEKVQERIDMMVECEKLIRKYVSRNKVIPMIESVHKVSKATAYRIYDDTQRLFGETSIKNQQFWLDIELGALEEDIKSARIMKDFRSVASLRKIKADLIMKLMGSGDAQLYEKIQPPKIILGFFPRSMEVPLPKDPDLKKLVSEKLKAIAEDVEVIN